MVTSEREVGGQWEAGGSLRLGSGELGELWERGPLGLRRSALGPPLSRQGMFEPYLKSFYIRSTDPTQIKILKVSEAGFPPPSRPHPQTWTSAVATVVPAWFWGWTQGLGVRSVCSGSWAAGSALAYHLLNLCHFSHVK